MYEIFAVDIGGTNSRFALFHSTPEGLEMGESASLATAEASSFQDLLTRLDAGGFPLHRAGKCMTVLAVPGPVRHGQRCNPPNIPWDIDLQRDLFRIAGGYFPDAARVLMINDFIAQAYATQTRIMGQAILVQRGCPDSERTVAVIGAGTGLGHCALVPHAGGYVAVPSEAGHTAFAFVGDEERAFESFVLDRLGVKYCEQEDVVSGSGLSLVHEYLSGERLAPADVAARLDRHPRTVRWFARLYARAARQYTLQVLATGGVFLTSGVAAKNPQLVLHPAFAEEFLNCSSYVELLKNVPVVLNVAEESGLYGAAFYGLQVADAQRREISG